MKKILYNLKYLVFAALIISLILISHLFWGGEGLKSVLQNLYADFIYSIAVICFIVIPFRGKLQNIITDYIHNITKNKNLDDNQFKIDSGKLKGYWLPQRKGNNINAIISIEKPKDEKICEITGNQFQIIIESFKFDKVSKFKLNKFIRENIKAFNSDKEINDEVINETIKNLLISRNNWGITINFSTESEAKEFEREYNTLDVKLCSQVLMSNKSPSQYEFNCCLELVTKDKFLTYLLA